jgi:hypothetical protein
MWNLYVDSLRDLDPQPQHLLNDTKIKEIFTLFPQNAAVRVSVRGSKRFAGSVSAHQEDGSVILFFGSGALG